MTCQKQRDYSFNQSRVFYGFHALSGRHSHLCQHRFYSSMSCQHGTLYHVIVQVSLRAPCAPFCQYSYCRRRRRRRRRLELSLLPAILITISLCWQLHVCHHKSVCLVLDLSLLLSVCLSLSIHIVIYVWMFVNVCVCMCVYHVRDLCQMVICSLFFLSLFLLFCFLSSFYNKQQ